MVDVVDDLSWRRLGERCGVLVGVGAGKEVNTDEGMYACRETSWRLRTALSRGPPRRLCPSPWCAEEDSKCGTTSL